MPHTKKIDRKIDYKDLPPIIYKKTKVTRIKEASIYTWRVIWNQIISKLSQEIVSLPFQFLK